MEQADIDAIKILNAAAESIVLNYKPGDPLYAADKLARAIRYLRNGHVHHTKNRTYRSR